MHFYREWEQLTTDVYVRSVVREGYRIDLSHPPPLSPVPIPMRLPHGADQVSALLREVTALLDKGAIEEVNRLSLTPDFYSRILLVPKKDGGFRPVFDLKSLNAFVVKEKFKMATPRVVTSALHKGDWAVSIDLKDAYFHVPIHVRSRRLLRFALTMDDELRIFQFRALPFGLTSAPRVFTKVILPVGQSAHMRAVCLLQYLDDWLLRSPYKLPLARHTSWLLDVIRRVGFIPNVPKSQLVPTQRLTHIGVEYQLDIGLMFPPMERVQKFEGRIRALLTVRVTTAYFWLSLLGLLSFSNICNPTRSIAPKTSAALSTGSLGAHAKELAGVDPSETRSVGPPSPLVVRQRVYEGRNTTRCTSGSDPFVYKCVLVVLGSQSRHTPSEWILVRERGQPPHQSLGVDSGLQCLDRLQESVDRCDSST